VHDNQGHDLSYRTFINGVLFGHILIDTTQVATDTIDYVATDTWGNTATSTRTVIIEAAPSIVPTTPPPQQPAPKHLQPRRPQQPLNNRGQEDDQTNDSNVSAPFLCY
jgi:hypothetical protein